MPDLLDAQNAQRRAAAMRGPSPLDLAAFRHLAEVVGARMERLAGEDEWETFWAQAEISLKDPDTQALAAYRDQIEGGELVGDDLTRATVRMQYLRGRLAAYRDLQALPAMLVERNMVVQKTLDSQDSMGVQGG